MNELMLSGGFDASRVDRGNYFLSLAAEALRSGVCTGEEYAALERSMYECLGAQILLYTSGLSTSVEADVSARLLGSLLYNADLSLLKLSVNEAVCRIFSEPLWDIFQDGMKLNGAYTLKAMHLLGIAKSTRIDTACVTYNRMLDGQLHKLIRSNDIRFDARRTLTAVDYPMPTVNKLVRGIGGMIHLLTELESENRFVNSFSRAELEGIQLCHWHELTNPYGATLINLGQLCFEQAVLNLMADKPCGTLRLTSDDCRLLCERYTSSDAYTAAVGVVHRLAGRAPEGYIMKLLQKFRVSITVIFSGGEQALRNYAGFRD